MKKLNNFTFGVTITLSILLCCKCFQYAAGERPTQNIIGGEVFTLALPLLIIKWKMWTAEQEQKSCRHADKENGYSFPVQKDNSLRA